MKLISLDYLYSNDKGMYSLSDIPKGKHTFEFEMDDPNNPIGTKDLLILVSANNEKKAIKKLKQSIESGLLEKIDKMSSEEVIQGEIFYS